MKKLLAILLSAMLVFSMVACSNDTPSPQAPVETPTELDKVNDKLDSASSAFESVKPKDDGQGNLVQTVENIKMDGYTIKEGTKKVASDGTETTALTIEYEENGQKVQIQNTQSEKVSVSAVNATGEEVVLDDEVAKEATETALASAKAIPASQFVRTGENEYTYTPASTMARLARTGESVSSVVIRFTYEDSKAVYTYEVTYITAGNTLTVTQEVSKETKKSVLNVETGKYEESNDEIKDNLMNDFSLGNLQPGGNSFYREEALDAAFILRDGRIDVPYYYGFPPIDYTVRDSNNDTITIENGSGKKIAFTVAGSSEERITYNYYSSTSESTANQTVFVESFDIDIPFISDYVKAGDMIVVAYSGNYENEKSSSTVTITVKDGSTEKLVAVLKETSTQTSDSDTTATPDNQYYDVSTHTSNTTIEFTLTDSQTNTVLASGSIKTEDTQTDTQEVEVDEDGSYCWIYPSYHKSVTNSTVTFETLAIEGLRNLFELGPTDSLVIETTQKSTHEENEFHEIINETTETTITVNDKKIDYEALIKKMLGKAESLIEFANEGFTLAYNGTAKPNKYNGIYDVYDPKTGYNNSIEVKGITRVETTDFTLNIRKGAVDRLVELLEAMMGGNGSMPNVNPNDFGSGNMVFTRDYSFDSSFFGAKGVTFVENTPMSASMPTYRIEFKDGYMKGAYTFTEEELWNNNMYY